MIPVPLDSPVNSSDVRRSHSLDVQCFDTPLFTSNDTSTGSSTITASSSMASCKSSEPSVEPDPDEDIENFLSKVDSSIAVTKKSVEQTRKQSDILAKINEAADYDDDNSRYNSLGFDGNCNSNGTTSSGGTTYAGTRRKISYEGAYQNLASTTGTDDHASGSRRSNSRRHIKKNSFHRLEQQQDELFEL